MADVTQVRVQDAGQVTCTLADPLSNILWLGHSDGRVSAFSMGDAPGTAVNGQLLHCWQVNTADGAFWTQQATL